MRCGQRLASPAIIGVERERQFKSAGLRTHILVGLGAALFTLVSAYGFASLGLGAVDQQPREALQQPLPYPSCRLQLVAVTRDADRGQVVDVGEDHLGEDHHPLARHPTGHSGAGELVPGHPRADAVGREQRVHRAARAGLATPQVVRPLPDHLGDVPLGIVGQVDPVQETGERHPDGLPDGVAHRPGEGAGVARHLSHHCLDDRIGNAGQLGTHRRHDLGGEPQLLHDLSVPNKVERQIHVCRP